MLTLSARYKKREGGEQSTINQITEREGERERNREREHHKHAGRHKQQPKPVR